MKATYNKSMIFTAAWRGLKSGKFETLSAALKAAWSYAKHILGGSCSIDAFKSALWQLTSFYGKNTSGSLSTLNCVIDSLTGFAREVANSVVTYKRCSEKQLYVICRGLAETKKYFVKNREIYSF